MRKNIILFCFLFLASCEIFGQNPVTIPVTDCPEPTFSHNTEGWSLFYADGFYNQNIPLSSMMVPQIHYEQGGNGLTSIPEGATGPRISIETGQQLYDNTGVNFGGGATNLTQCIRIGGDTS